MARVFIRGSSNEQTLNRNPMTLWQAIAGANHRVCVQGIAFSFKGTSPTDAPILCQAAFQGAAFTTPVTLNPTKKNAGDPETLITTGAKAATSDAGITTTTMQFDQEVHPQSPFYILFPPGQEIIIGGGSRMGLVAATALTYAAIAAADLEE